MWGNMWRTWAGGLAAAGIVFFWEVSPVDAEDAPFAAVYTAGTMPTGEVEFEQWTTWAWQKPGEDFRAFEERSEVEYGVSDRFLLSVYANYSRTRIVPHDAGAPDGAADETKFDGFSAEAIYQVLDADRDSVGLAFYVEPGIGAGARGLEGKVLLQKNFLDDRLIVAANFNLEYIWEREDQHWEHGSALEFHAGASYRIAPLWFAGAELLNENVYRGHLIFSDNSHVATAFYAGPTLHYGDEWWLTLSALAQLPWGNGRVVEHGFASNSERFRLIFRFGIEL
jgi:hypothetical protein